MAIVFHCEACKRKIQAPDGSGGKYAPCPYCKHKVYIPMPKSATENEEELRLEPLDETEEQKRERMMRETYSLQINLLKQKEIPEGADLAAAAQMDDKELLKHIIIYLRQMADGQTSEAQTTAEKIMQLKAKARTLLDRIATSDMPEPELRDVPPNVLTKLIKAFRTKLQ
jgi:DNA-directed RNA polymerase subunit RPC12/RpoP